MYEMVAVFFIFVLKPELHIGYSSVFGCYVHQKQIPLWSISLKLKQ
jgi:hypothetical protein